VNIHVGSTIRFTYTKVHIQDRFKEILVLNPSSKGIVHGIDLKRLTVAEREVLRAILDPANKKKRHKLPLVNDILSRMNPSEDIKNPIGFYQKFIKVFLRNVDAYRKYNPSFMMNVTTVDMSKVKGHINANPLFKKI